MLRKMYLCAFVFAAAPGLVLPSSSVAQDKPATENREIGPRKSVEALPDWRSCGGVGKGRFERPTMSNDFTEGDGISWL